jgi:cold-inducible RNA-binding protein
MANKLYVGNISYHTTEEGLKNTFAQFGEVLSAKVIIDRETGRSKGFAFVEMSNDSEAQAAIQAMDSKEVDGRKLKVNEATEKPARSAGPRW